MIRAMLIGGLLVMGAVLGAQAAGFDDETEYASEIALMSQQSSGPAGQPWLQHLGGTMADTAKFKKNGPYTVCFSNASLTNPWRVSGWTTMQAEVDLHKDKIKKFIVSDAEGKDDKQISDIHAMLTSGQCDVLIVSPNTTAALTPAIEEACKALPVVVFDRGVDTKCPVTFIRSIGGYAFGDLTARYVAKNVPKGGKVLALRSLPGIDILETRWSAAKRVFDKSGVNVVGVEFVEFDAAKTKSIVEDYLRRVGKLDGIWMEAGATSVTAIEAFEDAGLPLPVVTGEDQEDYLRKWKEVKLKGIAATYPAFMWRTAILASLRILEGAKVPGPLWILPQPAITSANLGKYVNPGLSPLHYAMCGCEGMPGYPQRWGGKK